MADGDGQRRKKNNTKKNEHTFLTSSPRSLNAAVKAVRRPGRLGPATRTTVVDASATLSMEMTGAEASVGFEIARRGDDDDDGAGDDDRGDDRGDKESRGLLAAEGRVLAGRGAAESLEDAPDVGRATAQGRSSATTPGVGMAR